MIGTEYAMNRAAFSRMELAKYRGQWIAFSPDGRRVIAAAHTLEDLESQLVAEGEDPEQLVYEQVPEENQDVYSGGAEFLEC